MGDISLEDVVEFVLTEKPELSISNARDQVTGFAALDHDVLLNMVDAMRFQVSEQDARTIARSILDPTHYPH